MPRDMQPPSSSRRVIESNRVRLEGMVFVSVSGEHFSDFRLFSG